MAKTDDDTSFEVDGVRYSLAYDLNVICDIEDELDLDSVQILTRVNATGRVKFLRTVFRQGLQRQHADMTDERAGMLMGRLTGRVARAKILAAMVEAFPVANEPE